MGERLPRIVAASGAWGQVEYAIRADGSCPAKEYMGALEKNANTRRDSVAFFNLFRRMSETGRCRDETQFRRLTPSKVYEFKSSSGHRLFCLQHGNVWIVTHGCPKPKKNQVAGEVSFAEKVFAEDQVR